MFRTLIINRGERIGIRDNWVTVETEDGEQRVPLNEIYAVVIDNQASLLTVPVIHRLTSSGAHILICDEKHMPASVILPQNNYYHPLTAIRRQLEMTASFKDALWDIVIAAKIRNQALVLSFCGGLRERVERLNELSREVVNGDEGNREGIAAKMFFRSLYGSSFVRMADDGINAALNYGYAVIRSTVSKTLCAHGYNCVVGIHHIGESNPFNLADDLMEPLRPLADYWTDRNHEDITDELTRAQRNELAALVNEPVLQGKRRMLMRNAVDEYVRSLTSAISKNDPSLLVPPVLLPAGAFPEEDDDQP